MDAASTAASRPGRAPQGRDAGRRTALSHLAARKAAKHASAVIAVVRDALLVVDERGTITDVNDAFCAMTGFARHQLIGTRRYAFWPRAAARANARAIRAAIDQADGVPVELELPLVRRDGERFDAVVAVSPMRDTEGTVLGYASALREQAPHAAPDQPAPARDDERARFDDIIASELSRARRHGRDLSLVLLRVDDLPGVGEDIRDRVLDAVADVLSQLIRTSDSVTRLRRDVFAWLVPETDIRSATLAAERARTFIGTITVPGGRSVSVSCGIADAGAAGHDRDILLDFAERALWEASTVGPGIIARFGAEGAAAGARQGDHRDVHRSLGAATRVIARQLDERQGRLPGTTEAVARLAGQLARLRGWTPHDAAALEEAALLRDLVCGAPHGAEELGHLLTRDQLAWVGLHTRRFDGADGTDGRSGRRLPEGARLIAVAGAWIEATEELTGGLSYRELTARFDEEAGWRFCPEAVAALRALTLPGRAVDIEPSDAAPPDRVALIAGAGTPG